ncbi:esterase-like activity of phytase family protein [Thorsellia anophelis]|uniref:Esterase-like activity of phytase n=1 Tax=Thorsellia anophelis DSM 18579 TaxID=1123402 RepID=A0A1H9ZHQ3_9GAMM|nr:esterase-like activity of phytase family protein [Thorsellia anophelis]SES81018.1 Esterase-like activity of phytase [Thorsellia anophelis DSM 18579]
MKKIKLSKLGMALSILLGTLTLPAVAAEVTNPFKLVSHYPVDGVAEIVTATPDGQYLFYTNAAKGTLHLVDVKNPASPISLPTLQLTDSESQKVEPTSVAISPDGQYAFVVIRTGDDKAKASNGKLKIFDISDINNIKLKDSVVVGSGPDSIDLIGEADTLRAVIAIEDEETDEEGDATIPGVRPGSIDVVYLGGLYSGKALYVETIELVDALKATPQVNYPEDPQPEFVSVNHNTAQVAVTLQENNAIALLDLSNPEKATLSKVFSTLTVKRDNNADLKKDGEIHLKESFEGRREADAVTWISDTIFAIANEGDTKKGDDGIYPGARGFTLFDNNGNIIYETFDKTEANAVIYGHYPDSRSAAKGVEIEGILSAEFDGQNYLFVGSERGSFVEVYQVGTNQELEFVQLLPTGISPEGLTSVHNKATGKELFVTANEKDGSLSIFEYAPNTKSDMTSPVIKSTGTDLPWGSLSGLTHDETYLYAVPDNAFKPSRIFRINPAVDANGVVSLDKAIFIKDENGESIDLDLEGISYTPSGFWLAVEGEKVEENVILKTDLDGKIIKRISLPNQLIAQFVDKEISTGFEGIAVSEDESNIYVALQRGVNPSEPFATIIHYDVKNDKWLFSPYPLDQNTRNAEKYWTGISDLALDSKGQLLVLERDKGGDNQGAINAEIKKVYRVDANEFMSDRPSILKKTLVSDLVSEYRYLNEKVEGMTQFKGDIWVVNDNDGAGKTRLINIGNR